MNLSIIRSLKRAYYSNKKILYLILAAIIVGVFAFGVAGFSSQAFACDEECVFDVDFEGVTFDSQNDTSTWNYELSDEHDCPAISHWALEPCYSLEELNSVFIDATPGDYSVGSNGSTLHYGVQWENPSGEDFSITIEGQPEIDEQGATAVIKAGQVGDQNHGNQPHFDFIVPGPSCAEIPEPYCGDGNLDDGEDCDDGNTEDGDGCSAECLIEQPPEPECTPEDVQVCDTGLLGICGVGTQTCDEGGFWGDCIQNSTSTTEICDNQADDNCDGYTDCEDEGCFTEPVCEEGPTHTTTTILAFKVVCESEEDLPNWGNGTSGPSHITATTAVDYIENSSSTCWFADGWDFQWGFGGEAQKQTGDYIGTAPDGTGWNDFDLPTGTSTPAEVKIIDLEEGLSKIWVRENLEEGYIPFANPPGDSQNATSAEMWCHDDILNYDNYDYIRNPESGETYYCVAFNTPIPEEPECEPEATQPCNTGLLGVCLAGTQTCDEGGFWGDCVQNSTSTTEACDNGLDDNCDGYTDCEDEACFTEPVCEEGPGPGPGPGPELFCGDGLISGEEECDEGQNNGTECSPEYGSSCNYCSAECETIDLEGPYCGDGDLDQGYEECDDGNTEDGDGCSSACLIEQPPEPECTPEDVQICDTGQLGMCLAGTQTCDEGGFWGECVQDNASSTEICNDGLDNDCNGYMDCEDGSCTEHPYCEGEPSPPTCTPSDTRVCGTGQLGICAAGTQTCNSEGFWGVCEQDEEPRGEDCDNGLDDDCDGDIDCNDTDCTGNSACEIIYYAGPGPSCIDADLDNYFAYNELFCLTGNDCDDSNAEINPGASENCQNELDDDCDGLTDCEDGACIEDSYCVSEPTGGPVCTDLDEDGYAIEGDVCGPIDCDDINSNINPGASENCDNQIDDDCDDNTDCDDADCVDDLLCEGSGGPQCTDSDGDGYAVEGDICGLVDCNDANLNINPAATEICDNGVDDDCDGYADCNDGNCFLESYCRDGFIIECGREDQKLCDTGLSGICAIGTKTCSDEGIWSDCVQNNEPSVEVCNNGLDDDCDDDVDCEDSDCLTVPVCTGQEEEEQAGFIELALAQVGDFFSNLFTNGKALCLPGCLPWWLILILFLYSLIRTIRVWKKNDKETRTWLAWTLILLILTFFFFKIFTCLTIWLLLILVIGTFLIHRSLPKKEEEQEQEQEQEEYTLFGE